MDPYIEQSKLWVDFHNGLADEIRAHLNAKIRPTYFARMTPYTTYEVVEISQSRLQNIRPDVGVMRRDVPASPGEPALVREEVTAVESAVEVESEVELLSVEIHHAEDEVLVTAIEILSPVNKQPSHQAYTDYLRKRRELLRSNAHLIEIDLLRGGTRPPLKMDVPRAPYYIMLSRAEERPFVKVWPIPLNAKLPTVPVPLRAPDPDATLELGKVVANVYERGGYDVQIDYDGAVPPPALLPEEKAWVQRVLAPEEKEEKE
jgi:hypothetical protein